MATATYCNDQQRARAIVLNRLLMTTAQSDIDDQAKQTGGRSAEDVTRKMRVWQCTAEPTTAATGQAAHDLVIDTAGDYIWRYISSNTFINITAEA